MQASDDAFGADTGGSATVMVEEWETINLTGQANGSYEGSYPVIEETPDVFNSRVIVSFTDRASNEAVSLAADKPLTAWWAPAPLVERSFPLGESGALIVMCWIPACEF